MPGMLPGFFIYPITNPKTTFILKGKFEMKNFKRIITLCLALMLCLSSVPAVFAAEVADATIDTQTPNPSSISYRKGPEIKLGDPLG